MVRLVTEPGEIGENVISTLGLFTAKSGVDEHAVQHVAACAVGLYHVRVILRAQALQSGGAGVLKGGWGTHGEEVVNLPNGPGQIRWRLDSLPVLENPILSER